MNTCPKCKSIVLSVVKGICDNCGALINQPIDNQLDNDNDDLEFVVTETSGSDPEFVGGTKKFEPSDESEKLGVTSNAEMKERDANQDPESEISENSPIGESAPTLPEPLENDISQDHNTIELPPSVPEIKKLSPSETNSFKLNPEQSKKENYLSESEKNELLSKLDKIPAEPIMPIKPVELSEPIQPIKPVELSKPISKIDNNQETIKPVLAPQLPKPKMADRPKGVAYFYKNIIQVAGVTEVYNGDNLTVNEREYILRPKTLKRNVIYGISAGLFSVILLLVASFFIKDTGSGYGQVIGMVTTENGTPLIESAYIKFPDENITVKSNAQGFFNSGRIPIGTHKVLYISNNQIIKEDYITVMDGKVSTILMNPDQTTYSKNSNAQKSQPQKTPPPKVVQKSPTNKLAKTTTQKAKPKATTKKKIKTPGKIVLSANVEGAKFELDGSVIGAGNLTYANIKPGKHTYKVSQDGYQEAAGTFTLSSGQKLKLKVALTPLVNSAQAIQLESEDFYYSGVTAYKEKNYKTAVTDLNEAIKLQPDYADAIQLRGDTYFKLKDKENAFNDYIRSAEIYQFKNKVNNALTSFNRAIKTDKKNINAYIGRAKLFFAKGENIAAAADFEQAVSIEDDHYQAQYGLGQVRFKLGNFKSATKHFKKAQKLDKKNPLTYQYLMLCYLKRDKLKDVKKTYKKFTDIATEKEVTSFVKNKKYSAVVEVLNKQ